MSDDPKPTPITMTIEDLAADLQPIADALMSQPDDLSTDMEMARGLVYIVMGFVTAPWQVRRKALVEIALAMETVSKVMVRENRKIPLIKPGN